MTMVAERPTLTKPLQGLPEWLSNHWFSEAMWEMAGLKTKPEKEDRGIYLSLTHRWDGTKFEGIPEVCLSSGPLTYSEPLSNPRIQRTTFDPLVHEFLGYHFPVFDVLMQGFVSQSDRKFYVQDIHPTSERFYSDKPTLRAEPFFGGPYQTLRSAVEIHLRDLTRQVKTLKGWGWL